MAERQEVKQQIASESAWRAFLSHTAPAGEIQPRSGARSRESHETDLVHSLIRVLAPARPCTTSQQHDLDVMRRSLVFFRDAAQRGVITDDEALAVMKLVVSQFVQSRFNCILWDTLGDEPTHRCTFRKVAGRLGHEREYESAR